LPRGQLISLDGDLKYHTQSAATPILPWLLCVAAGERTVSPHESQGAGHQGCKSPLNPRLESSDIDRSHQICSTERVQANRLRVAIKNLTGAAISSVILILSVSGIHFSIAIRMIS
jgi:hypothetical protein